MDSLTQIVLGAAVGEAVAGRKMGAKAALWGAIGGTIPDLDVFFRSFYHPFDAALVHRGFSHSLLFALLAGPALGWLFNRIYKRKYEQKTWIWLWFLAIVTHPLLDIFTNYGTQFLWPFKWRITFNTVFVIDPLYTVPFLIFLLMALFSKRDHPKRSRRNWIGIIWSCSYLLWGVIVKLAILGNAPAYFEESGHTVKRVMVTPAPLTSFYWQMVGEDDSCYYIGYTSLFGGFKKEDVQVIKKNHALLHQLHWNGPDREQQLRYITNDFYSLEQSGNTLRCYDLRFGTMTQLTGGELKAPIMGYGILVKDKDVQKSFPLGRGDAFKAVNFGYYLDKVLGK